MTRKKRATFVYIDGLNLFYRLKKCPHSKWLNLGSFVHSILESKRHEIKKIKYFTARVKKSKKDPSKTMRQDTYLRAIGQLPDLEIIPGQFKMRQVKGVLCDPKGNRTGKRVTIEKYEEKTSDVNLAVHMVGDGHSDKYDCAVLVSNDSDLVPPLAYVKEELKKTVMVISPYKVVNADLRKASSFCKAIPTGSIFKKNQFPNILETQSGKIHCPEKWR